MNYNTYYRPEWTCGKYNAVKHVAIMFNLIAQGEYFFENESADVVGFILAAGRNGEISVSQVSESFNISTESIIPFFESLIEIGLLSKTYSTKDIISSYRKHCAAQPNETTYIGDNAEHYLQCDISSVEIAYVNAVADCTEITNVGFELTYRCSEKCLHCYNIGATRNDEETSERGRFDELKIDEYKRIIDEMCDAGLVTATLTGGDPFSHKDVWDILEYLYKKDIAVTIQTNGLLLAKQIDKLADLYPRMVRVSLYSASPKVHDSITRTHGSWQLSIDVIKNLKVVGVPTSICCVIMRPALKSYLKLKDLGEQLCSPVLFDCGVIDSIEGDVCATRNLRLTQKEMEIVLMDKDVLPDPKDYNTYATPAPHKKGIPCLAGKGMFCVTPDGKLTPCISLHMYLGNLKAESFREIVQDNPSLQNLLNASETDYKECGTHEYCKCCSFCAGVSYSEHGNPFEANENNCYVAQCRYSLMMKLKFGVDILGGRSLQDCIESLPDFTIPRLKREYKKGVTESPESF